MTRADPINFGWNNVAGVSTYVLIAKRTGQPDRYTAVNGTTATPAASPGFTVSYSVRTAVTPVSAWRKRRSRGIFVPARGAFAPPMTVPSATAASIATMSLWATRTRDADEIEPT